MKKAFFAIVALLGVTFGVWAQEVPATWKKNLTFSSDKLFIFVDGHCGFVNISQDTADYIEFPWCDVADTVRLGGSYWVKEMGQSTFLLINAYYGMGSICVHTTKKDLKVEAAGICRVDISLFRTTDTIFDKFPVSYSTVTNNNGVDLTLDNLTVEAEQNALVNINPSFRCRGKVELTARDHALISYVGYEANAHKEETSEFGLIKGFLNELSSVR